MHVENLNTLYHTLVTVIGLPVVVLRVSGAGSAGAALVHVQDTVCTPFCAVEGAAGRPVNASELVQNVAIQMGLRLVSKGGAQITSLQRSVLRCDGCGNVCKSQSKVFCPACGHATLSKVSVTVGPDGTEHFGVRKRFTLRGTRCSPSPSILDPFLAEI